MIEPKQSWTILDGIRGLWRLLREPLAVVALTLISTSAIAQPFYVPTGSMQPTLAIGDGIVGSKFDYGFSRYSLPFSFGLPSGKRVLEKLPARGDVVVFRLPRDPAVTYVKRVIGLPGDRIRMHGGILFINGQRAALKPDGIGAVEMDDGRQLAAARFIETLPGGVSHSIYKLQWNGPLDNTAEFIVPPDHLFMMGDNRDDSLDSRVAAADGGVGFVPMENLVAHARLVAGSFDFPNANSPWQWPAQFRLSRMFTAIN